MSSPIGHFLGTTAVYLATVKIKWAPQIAKKHYICIAILSYLPDTDVFFLSIASHRGLTHGIFGTIIVTFLFYILFLSLSNSTVSKNKLAVSSFLCALVHPVMDILGCPSCPMKWLAPLSDKGFAFDAQWTMLPQPYFYIVDNRFFCIPVAAIIETPFAYFSVKRSPLSRFPCMFWRC
jgi:membrane-bound metal-dependent hydrolase YbcI (DUF457 family)